MMDATKRDREFIAGLAAKARLGEAQVPPPFTSMNLKARLFVLSGRNQAWPQATEVSFAVC